MPRLSTKLFVFFLVFGFSWTPLILSILGVGGSVLTDYSIYNQNWNGLSGFRSAIENQGYEVKPIISSLSSINRINEPSALFIIGPSAFYDPLASTSLIDYLNKGNRVVIADDFGSSNEILIFLGLQCSFSGQLLLDAASYDKNVSLPLINSFSAHQIFQGVSEIEFNYATAIAGTGFSSLAQSSALSWLDQNANYQYDSGELTGPFTVIASLSYGNGTLILISDPTLFNNDMISRADNSQFALNLVNWATNGDTSALIIVDEGHRADFSSSAYLFGLILGEINWISSNWLLAPIYPLLAVYLVKNWLPKRTREKYDEEEAVVGGGYFTKKIRWYRVTENYNKAISILFNKLKKDLIKMFKLESFNLELLIEKIVDFNPNIKKEEVESLFKSIEIIAKNQKVIADKNVFLTIFSDLNRFREMVGLK